MSQIPYKVMRIKNRIACLRTMKACKDDKFTDLKRAKGLNNAWMKEQHNWDKKNSKLGDN